VSEGAGEKFTSFQVYIRMGQGNASGHMRLMALLTLHNISGTLPLMLATKYVENRAKNAMQSYIPGMLTAERAPNRQPTEWKYCQNKRAHLGHSLSENWIHLGSRFSHQSLGRSSA
jgi:hypothetical protein